jgi:hypothetical protein
MSGALGRLDAALHDSTTVRESGSKLMRMPGLIVCGGAPRGRYPPPHFYVVASNLPHERPHCGCPGEPAQRSDGHGDPPSGDQGGLADPLRDGAGQAEDGDQRRSAQAYPGSVHGSQWAVSDAMTSMSSTPRKAKTPQVRRHHAWQRPERAYPPASPNSTTPDRAAADRVGGQRHKDRRVGQRREEQAW